jgi:hypothetical protein
MRRLDANLRRPAAGCSGPPRSMSARMELPRIRRGAAPCSVARALPIGLCLVVLGCRQQIMTPMAADALGPPPSLLDEVNTARQSASSSAPPPRFIPASRSLDGNYRGDGRLVRNPGGTCQTGMPVYGMQVSGDRVHFGSFNGTIQPNGVVEMDYGKNWVIGRFDGPHFIGRWIAPACSYELTLNRES